jgi:GTP-binding protein EngB required for normal cell division
LSKIDKLSNADVKKSLEYAKEIFFWQEIIWVSSTKKIWIKELVNSIRKVLV